MNRKLTSRSVRQAIFLWLFSAAAFAQTGSVSGKVLENNTTPIFGANVLLTRIRQVSYKAGSGWSGEPMFSAGATTKSDGSFTASSLPYGQYYVCALGTQAYHLASCDWNAPVVRVEVGASSSPSGLNLSLPVGCVLTIHITDDSSRIQNLPALGSIPARTNLTVGVRNSAGFHKAASLIRATAEAADYEVAVPMGSTVALVFDGPFSLADENGNPAPRRMASMQIFSGSNATVATSFASLP